MKSLTASLQKYLKVRRSFGYQLKQSERELKRFISFLNEKGYKVDVLFKLSELAQ